MPRHPPCALNYLTTNTKQNKMLASTMQHSTHHHTPTHHNHHHTHHTHRERPATGCVRRPRPGAARKNTRQVSPQDPTVCRTRPPKGPTLLWNIVLCSTQPHTNDPERPHTMRGKLRKGASRPSEPECHPPNTGRLLRKEVIQPHLPVRLPCYDFVPIAGPTFDSSLPYGLGHRLRVLPTFVT